MPQPKERDWLSAYKNKTHIYAVSKRHNSVIGAHTNWKWEDGRKYSMQMEIRRTRIAIFILEKIDVKIKTVKRDQEGEYIMIKGSI